MLQGQDRPIVIAHRGASGYLPEHTLESKALAYGLGADFLEQDVLATRDAELVVLHDLFLDNVTDVAQRFPGPAASRRSLLRGRLRSERAQGAQNIRSDAGQTAAARLYERRFASDSLGFRIVTLAEELELIQGFESVDGAQRRRLHGNKESALALRKRYRSRAARTGRTRTPLATEALRDPVFVQCFDEATLVRVRDELNSSLRLVQLVEDTAHYRELLSAAGLRKVASYAQGLGPAYAQLVNSSDAANGGPVLLPARLAADAKSAGLLLHPYTFRQDQLPRYASSLEELLEYFLSELRVDGVFCDHPDVAIRVRDALFAKI